MSVLADGDCRSVSFARAGGRRAATVTCFSTDEGEIAGGLAGAGLLIFGLALAAFALWPRDQGNASKGSSAQTGTLSLQARGLPNDSYQRDNARRNQVTHSNNPKSVLAEAKRYASDNTLSPRHVASLEQALQSSRADGTVQWCFSESPECLLVLTQKGEVFRFIGLYSWMLVMPGRDILFGTAPDGTIRAMEIGSTNYLGLHPSTNAADLTRRLGANKNKDLDDICARPENAHWMVERGTESATAHSNATGIAGEAVPTGPTSPSVHISSTNTDRTMAVQNFSELEARLKALIELHNKGLITDEDLTRRREEIIREL